MERIEGFKVSAAHQVMFGATGANDIPKSRKYVPT